MLVDALAGGGIRFSFDPFCGYLPKSGIVYKKDTLFLHLRGYWKQIVRPCRCVAPHTRLEGSLTTQASAYPDLLCRLIGRIACDNFPGGEGPWGHRFGTEEQGRESRVNVSEGERPSRRIKGSELFQLFCQSVCLGMVF